MHFARAHATKKMPLRYNSEIAYVKGRGMKERQGREENKVREKHRGV